MFMRKKVSNDMNSVKKRKGLLSFYDELNVATRLQEQNRSQFCTKAETSTNELAVDFLSTVHKDNVTYYYYINAYPRMLPLNFKESLRSECGRYAKITFIDNINPHDFDWTSSRMKMKLDILAEVGQEKDEQDITAYNLYANIEGQQSKQWIEDSLVYLADADRGRGCGIFAMTTLVMITGRRGVMFDNSVNKICQRATQLGLQMTRIMYNIPEVLRATSPFVHASEPSIESNKPIKILTDEIMARFNTYTQGILGAGGLYMGTDIFTQAPVLKYVKKTTVDPENWLITAKTGGGKSFLVKFLICELLAQGFNGTIFDIEGEEYTSLSNFLAHGSKVVRVNMGLGSGCYFDPVAIFVTDKDDDDRDAKSTSTDYTLAVLKILLGRTYEESALYEQVLDDVVAYTYLSAGVTADKRTWGKSARLTLHTVYQNLNNLIGTRETAGYDDCVYRTQAVLGRFFEPNGVRANLFRERINFNEIADADLVTCSFGLAGRDETTVDPVQMALMQLYAAQMSHQRSLHSFRRNKYNFKVWEEVQRWGNFPGAAKTIGTAITGGRKLGDVNIIVTNAIEKVLEDDKFAILSNYTSFYVGVIPKAEIRTAVCKAMSIVNMEHELTEIAKTAEKTDEFKGAKAPRSPYKHAFLCCLDGNKYGVVRISAPDAIAKSAVFHTGVAEKT